MKSLLTTGFLILSSRETTNHQKSMDPGHQTLANGSNGSELPGFIGGELSSCQAGLGSLGDAVSWLGCVMVVLPSHRG